MMVRLLDMEMGKQLTAFVTYSLRGQYARSLKQMMAIDMIKGRLMVMVQLPTLA